MPSAAPAEQRNDNAAYSRAGSAGAQRGSEQPGRAMWQGRSAAGAAPMSAAPDVATHEQQWETLTATDSDDDDDDGATSADSADFDIAYEQTLQRELAASRMGASFAKAGNASNRLRCRRAVHTCSACVMPRARAGLWRVAGRGVGCECDRGVMIQTRRSCGQWMWI